MASPEHAPPPPGSIGLALSGGGFRATLFSLGALWRLNEARYLPRLTEISSVSGGSILAGVLAHRWSRLTFEDGRATNFVTEIVGPVCAFCGLDVDERAGILGLLMPGRSAGEFLADRYAAELFHDTKLADLPDSRAGHAPRFRFNATNLQTGKRFEFTRDRMGDWVLGTCAPTGVRLADAVAASSAFPPFFSPSRLRPGRATEWSPREDQESPDPILRDEILLSDGGVYDNLGVEPFYDPDHRPLVETVLVSDAGAPFDPTPSPGTDWWRQLGRVRDIAIEQTRALRKRHLIDLFETHRVRGTYWGIASEVARFGLADPMLADTEDTRGLKHVPTRLKTFEGGLQGKLLNWGYAMADTALRKWVDPSLPKGTWPMPEQAGALRGGR